MLEAILFLLTSLGVLAIVGVGLFELHLWVSREGRRRD